MGPRWLAVFATAVLTLAIIPALDSAAGENDDIYEPGFTQWDVNNHNRLYVSGDDSDAELIRNNPPNSGQFTSFRTATPVEVFNIETPPLAEGFNASLNISTYFSAVISSGAGFPGIRAVVIMMSTSAACSANKVISALINSSLMTFA